MAENRDNVGNSSNDGKPNPGSPEDATAGQSDRKSLEKQLQRARRYCDLLREQKAGYGLRVPADLELELEEKEQEVARLEAQLRGLVLLPLQSSRKRLPILVGSILIALLVLPEALKQIGYIQLRNYNEKLQILGVILETAAFFRPWDSQIRDNLGVYYLVRSKKQLALPYLARANEMGSLSGCNNESYLYITLKEEEAREMGVNHEGRFAKAEGMLKGCLPSARQSGNELLKYSMLKNLGWALLGEYGRNQNREYLSEAEDYLREAISIELEPSEGDAHCVLAKVLEEKGSKDVLELWNTCLCNNSIRHREGNDYWYREAKKRIKELKCKGATETVSLPSSERAITASVPYEYTFSIQTISQKGEAMPNPWKNHYTFASHLQHYFKSGNPESSQDFAQKLDCKPIGEVESIDDGFQVILGNVTGGDEVGERSITEGMVFCLNHKITVKGKKSAQTPILNRLIDEIGRSILRRGASVHCYANGRSRRLPVGESLDVYNFCAHPRRCEHGNCYLIPDESDEQASPSIISPRQTALLNKRPTLRWQEVPSATSYTVEISQGLAGTVWQKDTVCNSEDTSVNLQTGKTAPKICQFDYPDEEPELKAGRNYALVVWPEVRGVESTPLDKVGFKILNEDDAANVIEKAKDRPVPSQAILYRQYELFAEAIKLLEDYLQKIGQKEESILLYQDLGDLHWQVERYTDAEWAYQKIIKLANSASDLKAEALAQARLGELYRLRGRESDAVTRLRQARELYEEAEISEETEFTSEIDELL